MAHMRSAFAAGFLVLASTVDVSAQAPPDAAAFTKEFVEAINSRSLERRKAVLHPKSATCARPESSALRDELLSEQMARHTVPPAFRHKLLPMAADQPLLFADKLDYPVRPTYLLQIDYDKSSTNTSSLVLQMIHEGGAWREVVPCPKPELVAEARALRAAAKPQREARVKALVEGMPVALRAEVQKHLQAGRKVEAINHYQSATGSDLATAKEVIDRLATP